MSANQTALKLAFIGGGNNSAVGYVHFSASQMDNQFAVVAGAFSTNAEMNQQTAQSWAIDSDRLYSDWRVLIDNEQHQVDAFVVLTPTPHHIQVLSYLMERQLPTICEKALVCDLSEIIELRHLIKNGQFLAVTFNYSGYAMIRELQYKIRQGELGTIQKIHLEMPQEGFRRPPDIAGKTAQPQAWRLRDGKIPTICLDLGVHLHHLSSFLLDNEPLSVCAEMSNHSTYPDLIDDVQMLLKYPNDITGSMWMSKTAIGHRNGLKVRVYGDKGSASWYQLNPDELQLAFNDGRKEILDRAGQCQYAGAFRYNRMKPGHPTGFVEAFANLYQDIAMQLRQHQQGEDLAHQYVFGLDQAESGLKLFTTAKQAAERQTWLKI